MTGGFSPLAAGAFELVFRPWMKSRLHALHVAGLPRQLPADRPLILAANHVSWFDGFILREVQRMLRPAAPFHAVMSATELDRFPFFRRLGVVGMDPGSTASIAGALRELDRRARSHRDLVLVYFPQGRIWPAHRRPLGFARGVELFARRLEAVALPIGLHLEPLNHVSPSCFVSVGEPLTEGVQADRLEREVELQLDAILALLSTAGEEVEAHWPPVYDRLPPPVESGPPAPP